MFTRVRLAILAVAVLIIAGAGGPPVPNDRPDWQALSTPALKVIAIGNQIVAANGTTGISTVTPTDYLVYGYTISAVCEGTTLNSSVAAMTLQLTDGTHTKVLTGVQVGTSSGSVSLWVPGGYVVPGINRTGTWTLQVASQMAVGTGNCDVTVAFFFS